MSTSKKKSVPEPQEAAAEKAAGEQTATSETSSAAESPEARLEKAQAEAAQHYDAYLRARADLENYRRRVQKEKEDLARYGNEELIREVLPVVDNLGRALAHAGDAGDGQQGLREGVEMTLNLLQKALERFGVKPVEAVARPFDPALHQAMGQVETAEHAPNTVVEELQKGYLLNERLLRPALVMVAKAPAAEAPSSEN